MDNMTVGVFDSGLGGLTAVRELLHTMPGINIVYFGDTGRVPYGTRSRDTIIRYTRQNIRFLKSFNIHALLIACGTASSAALDEVSGSEPFPIIGVVESTAKKAVEVSKSKRIGIIGTNATVLSGAYEKHIKTNCPDVFTTSVACPLFVPLVENGRISPDDKILKLAIEEYLTPIKESKVDTLILGCTHYPIIAQAIADFMGDSVNLINPGKEASLHLKETVGFKEEEKRNTQLRFFVSDDVEAFTRHASVFLGRELTGNVELINIEDF